MMILDWTKSVQPVFILVFGIPGWNAVSLIWPVWVWCDLWMLCCNLDFHAWRFGKLSYKRKRIIKAPWLHCAKIIRDSRVKPKLNILQARTRSWSPCRRLRRWIKYGGPTSAWVTTTAQCRRPSSATSWRTLAGEWSSDDHPPCCSLNVMMLPLMRGLVIRCI